MDGASPLTLCESRNTPAKYKTVGVLGAGVMGCGLTSALVMTGHHAVLVDISPSILEAAQTEISRSVRFQKLHGAAPTLNSREALQRVEFTLKMEALGRADFVVENVTEDWHIKGDCIRRLDEIVTLDKVIAVNTSAISITRIAARARAPGRVIGLHLMNPVPLKSTAEVIPGYHTTLETIDRTLEFLRGLGKEGIVVKDSPGFVSNRVLMLAVNEAAFLVYEGVATAEDADAIFKRCFGHKMGMLETADLIGLDTVLRSIEVLYESFNDPKYRPCPLLKTMVNAGLLGCKSGRGFYRYEQS